MIFYAVSESEIEAAILGYGSDILTSKGMRREKALVQHGTTSCYAHSVNVARMSVKLAAKLGLRVDMESMVRGALLHDYFLYDWHDGIKTHRLHGFYHPRRAYENARRDFILNDVQKDAILRHMFPLTPIPPKYREGVLITLSDKICATCEVAANIARSLRVGASLTCSVAIRFFASLSHY